MPLTPGSRFKSSLSWKDGIIDSNAIDGLRVDAQIKFLEESVGKHLIFYFSKIINKFYFWQKYFILWQFKNHVCLYGCHFLLQH